MSNKQERFLFEDKSITKGEYRPEKKAVKNPDNTIVYKKTSVLERRIQFNIHSEVQKRTNTIDRKGIEEEATAIVDKKLINLKLVDTDGKVLIPSDRREIAIIEETRKIIKERIDNRFEFSKKELLEITGTTSNNAYHLANTLNNLQGKDTHKIIETYVTEDFSEIRQRTMNINMFPMTGEDISLTNKDADEKIIIKLDEDFIPYLIAPNQKTYNKGFNILYAGVFESFKFEYSQILYKLVVDLEGTETQFTYKEFQKFFGTKYGVKKVLDKDGKPKKNASNDFIYELDKDDNYIYKDNYLSTYRSFKKEVLSKALLEVNSVNTPYLVDIIEIRDNQRSPIRGIKLKIGRKKNNEFNDYEKYSSVPYFAAIQKQFERAEGKCDLIEDLAEFGKAIENMLIEQESYIKPICGALNYQELELLVKENYQAIKEIKEIFSKNIKKLVHLRFDERYLIITDTNYPRATRLRIHRKLGDTAIESLRVLKEKYRSVLDEHKELNEKTLEYYLNFKYVDRIDDKTITINKKNIEDYKKQMEISIKKGYKRDFKAFPSMDYKKKFLSNFFGDE